MKEFNHVMRSVMSGSSFTYGKTESPTYLFLVLFACWGACSSILAKELDSYRLGKWPGYQRDQIHNFCVKGDLLYQAAGLAGLIITDISDPANPLRLGTLNSTDPDSGTLGVDVVGGIAYVVDWGKGLRIVDISDPTNPFEIGQYEYSGSSSVVKVAGDYAYIGTTAGLDLIVIDISNPRLPMKVSELSGRYWITDIEVIDSTIYFNNFESAVFGDISDPVNPARIESFGAAGNGTSSLAVVESLMFRTLGSQGIQILNVSNPEEVVVVGEFDTDGDAQDIQVAGSMVYVADGEAGLLILSVDDPSNPVILGSYETAGSAKKVEISGSLVIVSDQSEGLLIIDASDSENPTLLGKQQDAGLVKDFSLDGDFVYIADNSSGIKIVDVANPVSPSLAGDALVPAFAIIQDSSFAYVADFSDSIHIVDIHDPENPVFSVAQKRPERATLFWRILCSTSWPKMKDST